MNIKTTQNFTLILKLFRKMRNIFQQKLIGKNMPKNFFFTKFEYEYQNNTEFYADFEAV